MAGRTHDHWRESPCRLPRHSASPSTDNTPMKKRHTRSALGSVSEGVGRIAKPRTVSRSRSLEQQGRRDFPEDNDHRPIYHPPSPESVTALITCSKRKCLQEDEASVQDQSLKKRIRLSDLEVEARTVEAVAQDETLDPIAFWATHESWPPNFVDLHPRMSSPLSKKRSRTTSYTQSVRDGENPPAHSPRHAENMQAAGLDMADKPGEINEACRTLCEDLLSAEPPIPPGKLPEKERLDKVLCLVQHRNEARVLRDVTPVLVPSVESLHIDGFPGLEHATESLDALWEGISTLCGPKPKPDMAIGISHLAFTQAEKDNLRMHHTSLCPNLFPENMYYPFMVCEVKCHARPLREAEIQAMHSASIAANAIIQLYRKVSREHELDRKLLTISVAHNNSHVLVFGHFAHITDDKVTFLRHRIYDTNFAANLASAVAGTYFSGDWQRPYKVLMGLYERFFPKHLARIKSAVAQLRDHALDPSNSHLGLDSGEGTSSRQPGSDATLQDSAFKKPSLPSTGGLQQKNDELLLLVQQLQQQLEQAKGEQKEQPK